MLFEGKFTRFRLVFFYWGCL